MNFHLQILTREFEKRRTRNARYSLRAFASFLGLHPSALSRVFSTKQPLSPKSGLAVVQKLALDADEARQFLQSIVEERLQRESNKLGAVIQARMNTVFE
ncbi:MAG TPA: hypothetical protein VM432_00795 [Bdellovibrionales bacterium]|jgi:hypothetical protein|nr:hypothetical protein [Bdellovibrionales bacterium]